MAAIASGALMGRKSLPPSPFQPPTSFGINRVPPKKPLDPEKLLSMGLDLTSRARDQITEACDLFNRLDSFARANRNQLEDEDVVQVLVNLREDAEVLLERGLYSLDVALEVRTRLDRHTPEHGKEVTEESSKRWGQCFYAIAGVWARTYMAMYDMVLDTPTCGDLSHIPPQLHFDQPSLETRSRYNNRYLVAMGADLPRIREYWRRRIVKGVEAGDLPRRVAPITDSPRMPQRRAEYDGDDYSIAVGDRTYVRNALDELAGTDLSVRPPTSPNLTNPPKSPSLSTAPDSPTGPGSPAGPGSPGVTPRVLNIIEDSIDDLVGTPGAASTPEGGQKLSNPRGGPMQDPVTKLIQADSMRMSNRLREKLVESTAPEEPETLAPTKESSKRKRKTKAQRPVKELAKKRATEAPEPTRTPTKRKRRAETETGGQGRDDGPAAKKTRGPGPRLVEENQNMDPLTNSELAQLPWNNGGPVAADVDPRKCVFPSAGTPSQGLNVLADIRAWAEHKLPGACLGFDDTEGELIANITGPIESTVGDAMDVVEDDQTGTMVDTTRGTVEDLPSQGDWDQDSGASEELCTPSRHSPNAAPDHSVTLDTHGFFDGTPVSKKSTTSVPTAPLRIPSSPPSGPKSTPVLPPAAKPGLPGKPAPKWGSSPEPKSGPTPPIYKQPGPNYGNFSSHLPTDAFMYTPTPPRETLKTPSLPQLGRNSDTPPTSGAPDGRSGDTSGLFGGTELTQEGLTKGSDGRTSPRPLSSSEKPKTSSVIGTSEVEEPSSSEPTTGASRTPPSSGSEESSNPEGTTIQHFPKQTLIKFPEPSPPRRSPKGRGGIDNPPSDGSAKSGESMTEVDHTAISEILQEELDRKATADDAAILEAIGINTRDLPPRGLRETAGAVRLSLSGAARVARRQKRDEPDKNTQDELKKDEKKRILQKEKDQAKGAKKQATQKNRQKDGRKKDAAKEGSNVQVDDDEDTVPEAEQDEDYWRARSDAEPRYIGTETGVDENDDSYSSVVWDI